MCCAWGGVPIDDRFQTQLYWRLVHRSDVFAFLSLVIAVAIDVIISVLIFEDVIWYRIKVYWLILFPILSLRIGLPIGAAHWENDVVKASAEAGAGERRSDE